MRITKEHKIIAGTALEVFGGKPSVSKYWDENIQVKKLQEFRHKVDNFYISQL